MKIKSVENFTFEECREYLNQNPNGTERAAVEDRMNTILKQNAYTKEQEDKHKRLEQNQYENDVKWIDIKQFLANRKYRKFSGLKNLFFALLLSAIFLILASEYYCNTDHYIMEEYSSEQARCTSGIESLLLYIDFIDVSYWLDKKDIPCYHTYEEGDLFPTSVIVIVFVPLIMLCINLFHSPSLHNIYNIEKDEKTKSYRRTQNKNGKYGLHQCKSHKIVQVLPFKYSDIYYCGGGAYICVKGNKRGVYNTIKKKMVIDLVYDTIDIMQDGTLVVVENGISSRLTTDGYRIIE